MAQAVQGDRVVNSAESWEELRPYRVYHSLRNESGALVINVNEDRICSKAECLFVRWRIHILVSKSL